MGVKPLPPLDRTDLDHVMDKTAGLWDELHGKRLFITGGTGFFGCWLLESFIAANDRLGLDARVTVLSRDPVAFQEKMPHVARHESVSLAAGDMCTRDLKGERFDYVIHAAVESFVPGPSSLIPNPSSSDPLSVFEKNVAGTRNMLELARRWGARRFLLVSSGAVYGRQPVDMTHVGEEYAGAPDSLDPLTTYGQAKRVSEFICAAHGDRQGVGVVVARCFAFVGPHLPLDANFAAGNFIRDALHGGPIQVNGDGTSRRSYLYAADLAIWLWTILIRGQSGRAYNVGSDVDLSVFDLAHLVRKVVSPRSEVRVALTPAPGKPAERYVPSIRRARAELGLNVFVSLPDAIARTAAWRGLTPTQPA
ncbi:MAG TPA: NAD-dependent epimerase/dehydratase family protein [bacterium]|nr:NAD-dependent epimerase/dehydratase family protein [bacterium]